MPHCKQIKTKQMAKDNHRIPSLISPPGDTLKEHLEFIGMAPAELAEKMHVPQEKIHGLICGREAITANIATQLETATNIPATFWRNREKEYRRKLKMAKI